MKLIVEKLLSKQAVFSLLPTFLADMSTGLTTKIIFMQVKLDKNYESIMKERSSILEKLYPKDFNELQAAALAIKEPPKAEVPSPEEAEVPASAETPTTEVPEAKKKYEAMIAEVNKKFTPIWTKRLKEKTDVEDEHFTLAEFNELVVALQKAEIPGRDGKDIKSAVIYDIAHDYVDE